MPTKTKQKSKVSKKAVVVKSATLKCICPAHIKSRFNKLCKEEKMSVSQRIRYLILIDLNNHSRIAEVNGKKKK